MSEEVNFEQLNLQISHNIRNYSLEQQREILEYLIQLTDIEKKAYNIAYEHLKSSFNIIRSNGFKEWKKSKAKSQI